MLEISLRLEPLPEQSQTQALACSLSEALARMPTLAARAGRPVRTGVARRLAAGAL